MFEAITAHADDIAALMTLEMGKVLAESKGEVKYGAEFFRWFAEEAVRIGGRYTPSPAGTGRIIVTKAPVGPCYAITPWNFPLAMGTRKIGPAMAAGCTMLVKPAQETPLTMLLLAKLMGEAGLPKGVLSILPTTKPRDVTAALIDDGRLRKMTFTGSTGVGKALAKQASDQLLRQSLELGGNAPFIVFDDADVDAAVDGAILAKMRNGGEACTAANRFHIANAVREEFTEKLVKRMSEFTLGNGLDDSATLGPLDQRQAGGDRSGSGVRRGVPRRDHRGRRSRTGRTGALLSGRPCWPTCRPTPASSRRRSSDPSRRSPASRPRKRASPRPTTPNSGWRHTSTRRSLDRALRVAEALESGMVGVNRGVISDPAAPFGGVKQSGFGREGGSRGYRGVPRHEVHRADELSRLAERTVVDAKLQVDPATTVTSTTV